MRIWLLVLALLLALAFPSFAQSSPSIFTNPGANFDLIRRLVVLPFSATGQTVQDPFAATKATALLSAALKARGLQLQDLGEVIRRIQSDTGRDFSGPATEENLKVFITELPKHVDGVLLGQISAWGTLSQAGSQVIPIPVNGWVYGPGGTWSWQTTQFVQIQRTYDASVVGTTVALAQMQQGANPALTWQFSQVRVDRGGPFIWNHPLPPDQLADQVFQEVAKAIPLRP